MMMMIIIIIGVLGGTAVKKRARSAEGFDQHTFIRGSAANVVL
jgi:hypothetical protein